MAPATQVRFPDLAKDANPCADQRTYKVLVGNSSADIGITGTLTLRPTMLARCPCDRPNPRSTATSCCPASRQRSPERSRRCSPRQDTRSSATRRPIVWTNGVPLLVPEINPEHLALLDRRRGGGFIVTNPNCSTIMLVLALAPLQAGFGVEAVVVTTLQAPVLN